MSKEEIIEITKNYIEALRKPVSFKYTNEQKAKVLQGLLDLYEQEKENNNYLKKQIPSDKIFYYSKRNFVSKDKIIEKIEEYEDFRKEYPVEFRKCKMRPIITVLRELLEE